MKIFKTNNTGIVRTCSSISGLDCPAPWLLHAQRNCNLANLYGCNYRLCHLYKLVKFIVCIYCILLFASIFMANKDFHQ